MRRSIAALALAAVTAVPAPAQVSASYRAEEHTFNAAGRPADGVVAASASYRISLDAVAEAALGAAPASASFRVRSGYVGGYPPPGEVAGLRFAAVDTLVWDAHGSAGAYNVYRDLVSALPGLGFGACLQGGVPQLTTQDAATPLSRQAYFYLVTVENPLGEEGTKGLRSNGAERSNVTACP